MKTGSWGTTEYGKSWGNKGSSIPARFVLPVVNVPFEDFTLMVPRNTKQWFARSVDFPSGIYPLPLPHLEDRYSHEGPVHSCAAPKQWQRYPHLFRGIEQQCQCNTQFNDEINTYPAVKHTGASPYKYSEVVCNGSRRACVGACEHDYWVGDGICDAGNNNCGCWYDGGDCCGSSGEPKQYTHCGKACACADPTAAKHERIETGLEDDQEVLWAGWLKITNTQCHSKDGDKAFRHIRTKTLRACVAACKHDCPFVVRDNSASGANSHLATRFHSVAKHCRVTADNTTTTTVYRRSKHAKLRFSPTVYARTAPPTIAASHGKSGRAPQISPSLIRHLQRGQNLTIDILRTFDKICRELQVEYWLLGDTLVGALRFAGISPWGVIARVDMLADSYSRLKDRLGDMLPKRMWFHTPCKSGRFPWGAKSKDCDQKWKGKVANINYACSSAHNAPGYFGARLHIYGFRSTNNHLVEAWGHLNTTTGAVPTDAVRPVVAVRFQDFRVLVPRAPAVWFQHTRSGRFPEPLPRAQDGNLRIVKPCVSAELVAAYPAAFQGIEQQCVCGENRTAAMTPRMEYFCDGMRSCKGVCMREFWVGDGICDVGNNNCGCNYDGGDCCGTSGKTDQYAYW